MSNILTPIQSINRVAGELRLLTDAEFLARLQALPTLADEKDPAWDSPGYWQHAYTFVAMGDVAAERKLQPAVRHLLERACYGDPGEMMRGLRHVFEAIYNPDWSALIDVYVDMARSERLGTRMWVMAGLLVMDDARAAPIFETSLLNDPREISWYAESGLKRLARGGPKT